MFNFFSFCFFFFINRLFWSCFRVTEKSSEKYRVPYMPLIPAPTPIICKTVVIVPPVINILY